MPEQERRLVVKLTAGAEATERASQALTVAATGAASGLTVSLWLSGEATLFATMNAQGFSLEHAADPLELLGAVLDAGTVTVCTQCAARRGLEQGDLLAGVRIAGTATFLAEAMEADTALVY